MAFSIDHREQYARTQELLNRIQNTKSYNEKQRSILQAIANENLIKEAEAKAIAIVDKKLSEVEREYLETIKAQEIMDQIDEIRGKD